MDTSPSVSRYSSPDGVVAGQQRGTAWPLLICVLGPFRVLRSGLPLSIRGGKTEAMLCHLAVRHGGGVTRPMLLDALWPNCDATLAGEALYSRVRSLQKLVGAAIGGRSPVVQTDGQYHLNQSAGVAVDVACFDEWATSGDQLAGAGSGAQAAEMYRRAVDMYSGDLCVQMDDLYAVVERERLRARYLSLLAFLGMHALITGDHAASLAYARRMLAHDPCREDAHRLVMRCHVRLGERAQALHQFRVCGDVLRSMFGVEPEPATVALFDMVRRDPGAV